MDHRARLRHYFAPFPHQAAYVLGGCVLVLWLIQPAWPTFAVFLLPALGSGALLVHWSRKPNDAEVDVWQAEDFDQVRPRSLSKCGLLSDQLVRESVRLTAPRWRNLGGAKFGRRQGGDRLWRFTPMEVTYVHFTQHQLVIYRCCFDHTTGNALNEQTDTVFYQDVVAIATRSMAWSASKNDLPSGLARRLEATGKLAKDGTLQVTDAETFVLITKAGVSMEVTLRVPVILTGLGGGDLPTELTDQAIQAIRKNVEQLKVGS